VCEGLKLNLEAVKAASTDNLVTELQEIEIEEWIEIDRGVDVTDKLTDNIVNAVK
jgi:hypothetical protein